MPLLSTFGAASARSFGGIGAAAAGAGLDIDEAFSTYLYDGTGSAQTITNGIDLAGEGGLVWLKSRVGAYNHWLFDTERGAGASLKTNDTDAQNSSLPNSLSSFNSNGFSVVSINGVNNSGEEIASWTFRKAPKFFDIVTYTGNGSNRTIAHNLDSVPGMIIIKRLDNNNPWIIYHRSTGNTGFLGFDTAAFATVSNAFNNTSPTSTHFALGTRDDVNNSGNTYVAYLFAHNNNDGDFGPDADADVIKCGSYTGNGSTTGPSINLGFEPQFLVIKKYSGGTGAWEVVDIMRGFPVDTGGDRVIRWNSSGAENTGDALPVGKPTATGFQILTDEGHVNQNGHGYIYMAIRRGPLAEPESASDVFAINTTGTNDSPNNNFTVGFDPDLSLNTQTNGNQRYLVSRLLGNGTLKANDNTVVNNISDASFFGNPSGTIDLNTNFWATAPNVISWSWKRARGYFDVVAYSGNGSTQNVSHNLGAVPEMIWIKSRNATEEWKVYHSAIGNNKELVLSSTAASGNTSAFNYTTPTSSVFSLGAASPVNDGAYNFIAYLFATVAGVSKVGSYTGTGSTGLNIDCGFSSGARFVMIKRTDAATYDWFIWDSVRGIVSGDDKRLSLNTTNAEVTQDNIDPLSSGFTISTTINGVNQSGGTYIFYAIA